jgi:hypothetical protein
MDTANFTTFSSYLLPASFYDDDDDGVDNNNNNNNSNSNADFFDCKFETNSVYWQLGCLLATYLLLVLQMDVGTMMAHYTFYEDLCKTHCKCFYIDTTNNTTTTTLTTTPTQTTRTDSSPMQSQPMQSPPPPYQEEIQAQLLPPTYKFTVENTDQLPTFLQAIG